MRSEDNLETMLLREKRKIDLAEAALIASGVKSLKEIEGYLAKIDTLCHRIAAETSVGKEKDIERARAIFAWLWRTKPNRYEHRGNFRLTTVVEAQLDDRCERVGNCLGLTILYNTLAQRFGLTTKAVYLEEAFGTGPHIFSLVLTEERPIDVENIFPYGFDYHGHCGNPLREEWGNWELVADIYLSIANSLCEQGDWGKAIENYDKAIRLNPRYTKAYLNKGIALTQIGKVKEAGGVLQPDNS